MSGLTFHGPNMERLQHWKGLTRAHGTCSFALTTLACCCLLERVLELFFRRLGSRQVQQNQHTATLTGLRQHNYGP